MDENNNTTTDPNYKIKVDKIRDKVEARVLRADLGIYNDNALMPDKAKILIITGHLHKNVNITRLFPDACCIPGVNGHIAASLKPYLPGINKVIVCQRNNPDGEKMVKDIHQAMGDKVHRLIWGPDDTPGIDINDLMQAGQDNRVRAMIEGAVWVTQSKSNCKFILQKLGDIKTSLPDWLIKGLIEKDTVSVIFGDPESGKSFIAIDMACHIATNKPYHGRTVKSGSVIYIAGEGQNGLKRRFDAWAIRHKKSLDNAPIYLSLQPAAMADTERVLIVKQAIDEVSINEGAPPSLIVIDTLTRNFGPGDQNNSRDMVAFISGVDVIRAEYRAALVIVHHSGHGDKSRGKGAIDLKGAIDTEYRAEKDELGTIRVTCTKMKDHQKTNPFALKFRTVELGTFDDEGEPVTSSILDPVDYTPPEQNGPKNLGKWQTVCQGILISLFDEKRRNLEKGNYDPNQAKILISDVKQEAISHGLNPKNWNRYFNHLSNLDEFIVNQPYFELHPQNSSNNLKEEK